MSVVIFRSALFLRVVREGRRTRRFFVLHPLDRLGTRNRVSSLCYRCGFATCRLASLETVYILPEENSTMKSRSGLPIVLLVYDEHVEAFLWSL